MCLFPDKTTNDEAEEAASETGVDHANATIECEQRAFLEKFSRNVIKIDNESEN